MKSRGNFNKTYKHGFKHEQENINLLKETILYVLHGTALEPTTGTIVDKATGIDAYVTIQENIYGISLRVREKDFNSFTLNRHFSDQHSEIHKWVKFRGNKIKPSYHIQLAKKENNLVNVFRINIDVFSIFLKLLIKTDRLEKYYNSMLLAYEFTHEDIKDIDGIYNEVHSIM